MTTKTASQKIAQLRARVQRELKVSEYKRENREARKDAELISQTAHLWGTEW